MLSDAPNATRHESWKILRKNEKINQNYITPCYPTWKIELFSTSCKNHRYPASSGYHQISGSGISFIGLSGLKSISGPTLVEMTEKFCSIRYAANKSDKTKSQALLKRKIDIKPVLWSRNRLFQAPGFGARFPPKSACKSVLWSRIWKIVLFLMWFSIKT